MKIWLLENGERTGPHEVYDIRDRITDDELHADTPAWHEGAEDWVTLGDVATYSSYFNEPTSVEVLQEEEKRSSELIDSLKRELVSAGSKTGSQSLKSEPIYPIRRFFARVLDFSLYTTLIYIIKVQMGMNPLTETMTMRLLFHVPYLLLDGFALSYIGTTPGKWLLNIRLRASDGQRLNFTTSLIRSVRVWVLGFAMQSPFVIISIPFSWFIATKYGKFLWDIPKNNITRCAPFTAAKLIGYVLVIIAASYLFNYMVPPELIPTLENLKAWNPS
jgi:uncharacterized RDD family membrane protein YckC